MNTISKIKNILLLIIFTIALFSCENNVEEENPTPVGGNNECDTDISFSLDVKPIIDNNCISCHNGTQQLPDLRTFNGISTNASRVRTQVVTRRMPLNGSLSDEQIELIRCWIDNGALNN